MNLLQTKEPTNNSFTVAFVFLRTGIPPENGTRAPKHSGEASIMFILI